MSLEQLSETLRGAPGLVPIALCITVLVVEMAIRERSDVTVPYVRTRRTIALAALRWALVAVALAICAIRFLGIPA